MTKRAFATVSVEEAQPVAAGQALDAGLGEAGRGMAPQQPREAAGEIRRVAVAGMGAGQCAQFAQCRTQGAPLPETTQPPDDGKHQRQRGDGKPPRRQCRRQRRWWWQMDVAQCVQRIYCRAPYCDKGTRQRVRTRAKASAGVQWVASGSSVAPLRRASFSSLSRRAAKAAS